MTDVTTQIARPKQPAVSNILTKSVTTPSPIGINTTKKQLNNDKLTKEVMSSTDIFDELPVIFIGMYSFDNKSLIENFGGRNVDEDLVVSLLKRVFQKKYPVTRSFGLPKVPSLKSDKILLQDLLQNYFRKLRFQIIQEKKRQGDSMNLRQKIEQLQKIKVLQDHFEDGRETFPYHLFQNFIDNQDFLDFEGDMAEQLIKIKSKDNEENRIRNLLRQFAKLYLLQNNNDAFTLTDPGETKEKFEAFKEKFKEEKKPDILLDLIELLEGKIKQNEKPNYDSLLQILKTLSSTFDEVQIKKAVVNDAVTPSTEFATNSVISGGAYSFEKDEPINSSVENFILFLIDEYKKLKEEKKVTEELLLSKDVELADMKTSYTTIIEACDKRTEGLSNYINELLAQTNKSTENLAPVQDSTNNLVTQENLVAPSPSDTSIIKEVTDSLVPAGLEKPVQRLRTKSKLSAENIALRIEKGKTVKQERKLTSEIPNSFGLSSLFGNQDEEKAKQEVQQPKKKSVKVDRFGEPIETSSRRSSIIEYQPKGVDLGSQKQTKINGPQEPKISPDLLEGESWQNGGKKDVLYSHAIKIANNRLDDFLIKEPLPYFDIINSFDKSIIRETNEKYLLQLFVIYQLETHFDSSEMKDFFTQFNLMFEKNKDYTETFFVLYEICNKLIKQDKDIDVLRLSSTTYNSKFDSIEQDLKKSSFDFYDIASKQLLDVKTIDMKYHERHIYFKPQTNSFEHTYIIDSDMSIQKESYDFNEELYTVSNKVLYFFFILSVYNHIKSEIKDCEIVDTLLKHTRTTKRNFKKSAKNLIKQRIDGTRD